MKVELPTIELYLANLPIDRRDAFIELRKTIVKNLPEGFSEIFVNGRIEFVVPHTIYPNGYHCNPKLPLPFISIVSQKNFIALYHMGLYANPELHQWFTGEYPKYATSKLDMGKSCIRFKKINSVPFELVSQLCSKMSTQDWINLYETTFKS